MIPIYAAAMISKDYEACIDNQKSYKAVAKSPLAATLYAVMKPELDAIHQHQVFGNFVEFPEGRKAFSSRWVYKIERNEADNVQISCL
jgi:hypothetical protein